MQSNRLIATIVLLSIALVSVAALPPILATRSYLFVLSTSCLVIPLSAALAGLAGGLRRAWWITIGAVVVSHTGMYISGSLSSQFMRSTRPLPLVPPASEWPFLAFGLGLALAFAAGAHAMVARRQCRRQSAHACNRCGYDLTGNVSGRCPECGTPVAPANEEAKV